MEINAGQGFFLDYPYQRSAGEQRYLLHELTSMVEFLETASGRRMDWHRLGEGVQEMDRQVALLREIAALRRAVPSPFPPLGFLDLVAVDYLFAGQPEATRYLQTLRDELADAVAQGKGAVAAERFRLMSFFTPPMYLMGVLEEICREQGALSVTEPFFTYWQEGRLDPEKPLESVAEKMAMRPEMRMYGPLSSSSVEEVVERALSYDVDGAVYYADVGCRHCCATVKLFKDALAQVNVPTLTVDCDVVDPSVVSKTEIRDKLEGFLEVLGGRSSS